MKTITTKTIILVALIASVFSLNSCKKEENNVTNKDNHTITFKKIAYQQANTPEMYLILQSMASQVIHSHGMGFKKEQSTSILDFPCLVVTTDTASSPKHISLDFGSGCSNSNPNGDYFLISGSVSFEYSGEDSTGAFLNITYNNFVLNNYYSFNGTLNFTNTGVNGAGDTTAAIDANLQTNCKKDTLEITGINHLDVVAFYERNVPNPNKLMHFSGSGSGTTSGGVSFTQIITIPLTIRMTQACSEHFTEGQVLIQSTGLPDKTIDYGDGTCDDQATVAENGSSYSITLK